MKSRLTQLTAPLARHADALLGGLLAAAGLIAYTSTLAPTVLEGDAALFQYTPSVLGVTYPTGYPLYILLSKVWVTLLPWGELAWRMNLLSAVCAALALPLLYGVAVRLYGSDRWLARWAAVAAVLLLATLPTFWRWATEAKIYALNMLLFSGVLLSLLGAVERYRRPELLPASQTMLTGWQLALNRWRARWPLALPIFLFGLEIAVHSTTVLLIPGLLLLVWLNCRRYLFTVKNFAGHLLWLIAPGLLYFYIPLRAEWLIAAYGRAEAINRGLLADFYHSGLAGWLRYFSAADFTGGVVTNWGLVPQQFISVYLPLLNNEFSLAGVALGLIGGLALAATKPRLFWPLLLLYATPIPFVLTYGQGEQSAFLLPSFLVLALFGGYTLAAIPALFARLRNTQPATRITYFGLPPILLILLFVFQLAPQIQTNNLWLSRKWNRAIYNEWADALNHPLQPGAGLLAHWGDLTSFWYMQHAEDRRPDLRGVYPPTEEVVIDWFTRNPNLYIAGPLQGWAAGIEQRYQLLPWGRLVRIAPRQLDPAGLLPDLPQKPNVTFDNRLRLIGAEFAPQTAAGQDYPVALTWQALAQLGPETTNSLRLVQNGVTVAQLDEPIRSGWFPRDSLPAGQYLLSYPLLPVAIGTLPGPAELQLVVYQKASQPWPLPDGNVVLTLGTVPIGPPPPGYRLGPGEYKSPPAHDFNAEIQLAGYDYSVSRVGQGKGFALRLLWQALRPPADNYTLQVEQLDAAGRVLRANQFAPVSGRAPTAGWQAGQFVRDQVDLVVPASAPPGDNALQIRLSWLRPDGSRLNVRRFGIPLSEGLTLPALQVVEKEERTFTLPPLPVRLDANFEDKALLTGYTPALPAQFNRADCAAGNCTVQLELVWQGLSEMEQPYQIFVHVLNAAGEIVAQSDAAPGARGKQPTTGWLPGEVVTHPVAINLPANLAPGEYRLLAGMYVPPDGPRLRVLGAAGQPTADSAAVGNFVVR
ncbi:MAG: hypothetical protein FOGNACKC_01558 [Anaerolineae bacterium]|nr:hypothetical protein [Anaerolineae bacterium]